MNEDLNTKKKRWNSGMQFFPLCARVKFTVIAQIFILKQLRNSIAFE